MSQTEETEVLEDTDSTADEVTEPTPAANGRTDSSVEPMLDERTAAPDSTGDDSPPDGGQDAELDQPDAEQQETGPEADDAPVESETTAEGESEPPYTDRELNAARRFGVTADDLLALGAKGGELARRLAKAHSDIGRRYSRIGRTERMLREAAPANPQDAADGGPATEGAPSAAPAGPAPTPPRFDSDDRLHAMARELSSLREQVDAVAAEARSAEQCRERAITDRFFSGLDLEVYPQFGAKRGADLPKDSPEYRRRAEVVTKANEIRRGYELVHGETMDLSEAMEEAVAIVAPDAKVAADRKRLSENLRRRARQRIARPTHRRSDRQYESPAERTIEVLDQWEKERGLRFFTD